MTKSLRNLYQIKVSLNDVKPPIWRRLLISNATNLAELHEIIQIAMGWTDTHLHQFTVENDRYGVPDPDYDDGTKPEGGVRIGSLLKEEKEWLVYEYDFGDGWTHKIILEKILPYEAGEVEPRCIGGCRRCPPEDVGGPWGYMDFLEIYEDKTHPEHEEMVEWAGDYFDPDGFDENEVNKILSS